MKKFLFVGFVSAIFALHAEAQVVIAPPIVFISDQVPFGTFTVSNASQVPQEVDISFRFGYPNTDSLGKVFMDYSDSATAEKYSCEQWINGFPTKFILNPGQEQVVHMSVSAPDSLADGEYWTRLITTSQPQQRFSETLKNGISANIIFVFTQVTSVVYEKGNLGTQLDFQSLQTSQDSGAVDVYAHLKRGGNAPFLGEVSLSVSDQSGNVVYEKKELIAVYMQFVKKFAVPLSKLPPGSYTASVTVSSERPDIPAENLIKILPVTKSTSFSVN